MKNKLKLGQAAGVVAFAIIIGAVSMSSSSTVDARAVLKENRTVNAGVALDMTEVADATELLTAGATSALTYYGAELTVAQNDSNVVTASAQGTPQTDDASQESEQADEAAQANEAAQTPTAAQTCGYTNLGMSVISSGNLNIRQEASTDSEVVGILTNHNACELLEDAGDWYKVTSGKVTGYVSKQYLVTGAEAEAIAQQEIKTVATVNTETLNVRADKSTEAAVLSQVGNSEAFTVNSIADGWVEISVDDSVGYISQDYVTVAQALPTAKTIEQVKYGDGVSDVRASVVSYALQFVGNRYVWGGTSLEKGVDCSGFTMRILGKYGISLPHSSKAQPSYGTKISASEAKPGDLFFYGSGRSISHVAIYIGNGQIVHASNKRDGIKVSNAFYRNPICVARYLPD
nr:SH3 domain-containing C40 family peptidase [uncultured Agathobacter sp.]